MKFRKFLKYKTLIIFLLSVLFFGLAHRYATQLQTLEKPEKVKSVFEQAFQKQFLRTQFFLSKFKNQVQHHTGFSNPDLLPLFRESARESIFLFHYSGAHLQLWSDHACPVSPEYDSSLKDQSLIRLADGWYGVHLQQEKNQHYLALFKIKHEYAVENAFLQNAFLPPFSIHNYRLSYQPGQISLSGGKGSLQAWLVAAPKAKPGLTESMLLFFLYLCGLGLGLTAIWQFLRTFRHKTYSAWLSYILFPLILAGIRFLLFHFKLPHSLHRTALFSPDYYATSNLLPSPADLFLHVFFLFLLTAFWYPLTLPRLRKPSGKIFSLVSGLVLFSLIFLYFRLMLNLQIGLVRNSTISFEANDLFALNPLTWIAFLTNTLLWLAFALPVLQLSRHYYSRLTESALNAFVLPISLSFLIPIFLFRLHTDGIPLLLLSIFLFSIQLYHSRRQRNTALFHSVYLIILSAIPAYLLHFYQQQSELNNRGILAGKLVAERDPLTEFMITESYARMQKDLKIGTLLKQFQQNEQMEDSLISYIRSAYFTRGWEKYSVTITACDQNRMLDVVIPYNQIIRCDAYFSGIIQSVGKPTADSNIFYLDYGSESTSYLAILPFAGASPSDSLATTLYLDFTSKSIPRGLGYPELLVDQEAVISPKLASYSYAIYKGGVLVRNVGKYNYGLNLSYYLNTYNNKAWFEENNYSHLIHQGENSTVIVLSKPLSGLSGFLSLFSVSGILLLLATGFLWLVQRSPGQQFWKNPDFRLRIQLAMFLLLGASFLTAGAASWYFFRRQNTLANQNQLTEKAHSILIELQNKLSAYPALTPEMSNDVYYYLNKFSLIFFTDINVFDTQGHLIASSRPQIFENGFISTRINTEAYHHLLNENRTLYVKMETIGSYEFLSAYMPVRNQQDKVLGYINLPYFARQSEIRQEFSNFILAYINIYVILIAISLFAGIIITSYITAPLRLIREKIRKVSLSNSNEKIVWSTRDEIGALISEYNKMIDQLVLSAEQLARSERESAWREMARQVAHEIKNPLTPMKLSVQHMQRAWDEQDSRFDTRLRQVSTTLITQIDTLADIATAFSDFAKMPMLKPEVVRVESFLEPAVELYTNQPGLDLRIEYEKPGILLLADALQMQRVMINLIKNAWQAVESGKEGVVILHIREIEGRVYISVEDNGSGIAEEQQARIFTPNFTTKSGGMGLGLAMVKTIIEDHGGHIRFETSPSGTTFYLDLPAYEQAGVEKHD